MEIAHVCDNKDQFRLNDFQQNLCQNISKSSKLENIMTLFVSLEYCNKLCERILIFKFSKL